MTRIQGRSAAERAGRPLSYANVVSTLALMLVVASGTAIGAVGTDQSNNPHQQVLSAVSTVQQDVGAIKARMDTFEGAWEKAETEIIPRLVKLEQELSDHNANGATAHNAIGAMVQDKVLPRLFSLCEGQYLLSRDIRSHVSMASKAHGGYNGSMRPWVLENGPGTPFTRQPWQYCYRILPPDPGGEPFGNAGPQG